MVLRQKGNSQSQILDKATYQKAGIRLIRLAKIYPKWQRFIFMHYFRQISNKQDIRTNIEIWNIVRLI